MSIIKVCGETGVSGKTSQVTVGTDTQHSLPNMFKVLMCFCS